MSLALYRKYRSQSFDDVVGQDHITKTLKRSVDNKTFSHAYLLTGLRGVGKTSVARIFAAYVNGIEYQNAESNPDIIEIDAASNRKIDEIRDLREKVNIAPSNLQYKVYIIDEVHMLTREAFNALLKTLEEPPRHCILVLATTDYHKLPETIISRCIRFSFKAIGDQLMVQHLDQIATKEKIKVDKEALEAIAVNSSGSLRDAITVLDQARNVNDKITLDVIESLLGLASSNHISKLYEATLTKNSQKITEILEDVRISGANPDQVTAQLTSLMRSELNIARQPEKILNLLVEIMKISNYMDKWLALEVCLLKYAVNTEGTISSEPNQIPPVKAKQEIKNNSQNKKTDDIKNDTDLWQNILNELKKTNSTLYGVARMADANSNGSVLELKLKFNFHKKQLDIKHNKAKIIEIANRHNAKLTSIDTVLISQKSAIKEENNYDTEKDISNISNIFGSAEMLE